MQENTNKQTQYKSEKVNNLKYSKTKLPWFSCLLQHSARKRGGLILQRPRAHTADHEHTVDKWPLTKLEGGLNLLHEVDDVSTATAALLK